MRILHVTDTFLPRLGGIELHVADLAARQVAQGHDVVVLTAERGHRAVAGPPSARSYAVVRHRTGLAGLGAERALRRLVAHLEPDVVHAHLTVGSPFVWAVLRAAPRVPALASLHSLLPAAPRTVRAALRLTGIPVSRLTFTAVSQVAADRLRPALGGRPVHVLHNGIDPAAWHTPHRPSDTFRIVSVGRLAARKRPLLLVSALAALAASTPGLDWSATLIGDGAQRAAVGAAVRARGLQGAVRLPGALSREEIRRELAHADVFVAPAVLESFGIAALEARCAGVPIIGMAASGVTEFVTEGLDGLLADTDADLTRCLQRLAADRGLRTRLREHNRVTPVPMEWAAVLRAHERLYDAVRSRPVGDVSDVPSVV